MKELNNTTRDIARELARKYSTMTHDELDILESVLVPMKFAKGEIILKEGDVCEHIYYVERGLTRQFYFKNGKELTEHIGVEHSIVMCIESLFKEKPTYLQLEALEPTLVYAMPKHRLDRKILEESLIISQVHADMLRFETAQDRYLKLCKQSPQVVLRAPLVYVASYLQMTPETLSRVRAASLYADKD